MDIDPQYFGSFVILKLAMPAQGLQMYRLNSQMHLKLIGKLSCIDCRFWYLTLMYRDYCSEIMSTEREFQFLISIFLRPGGGVEKKEKGDPNFPSINKVSLSI